MTCTTHHRACQCREEEFLALRKAAANLMDLIDHYHELEGNIHMTEQANALRKMVQNGPARDPHTLLTKSKKAEKTQQPQQEQADIPYGVSHPAPGVTMHRIR